MCLSQLMKRTLSYLEIMVQGRTNISQCVSQLSSANYCQNDEEEYVLLKTYKHLTDQQPSLTMSQTPLPKE